MVDELSLLEWNTISKYIRADTHHKLDIWKGEILFQEELESLKELIVLYFLQKSIFD